ncbi:hypothetical protein [Botrimarina sp.]|uniref:GAP1-N2 domain-containing protein n=1 Tax=Botrimarina sp. TaxID=2795802 RepID=UPI0032EFECEF
MSHELLYTSAQRGLKPGSQGFCTVEATTGMPAPLAQLLESLSGYRHLADPGTPGNPPAWRHVVATLGGERLHVLSRVADAGHDYSGRSNKLAHHLVLGAGELPPGGPAWLQQQAATHTQEWAGQPRTLPHARPLPQGEPAAGPCEAWRRLTGDAGWGGFLPQRLLGGDARPQTLIVPAGVDPLALAAESLALLPPEQRWRATYNTFHTKLPPSVECLWRFVPDGTPEAATLRKRPDLGALDLCRPLGAAPAGRLVEAAREGSDYRTVTAAPPVSRQTPAASPFEVEGEYQLAEAGRRVRAPGPPPPPSGRPRPGYNTSTKERSLSAWAVSLIGFLTVLTIGAVVAGAIAIGIYSDRAVDAAARTDTTDSEADDLNHEPLQTPSDTDDLAQSDVETPVTIVWPPESAIGGNGLVAKQLQPSHPILPEPPRGPLLPPHDSVEFAQQLHWSSAANALINFLRPARVQPRLRLSCPAGLFEGLELHPDDKKAEGIIHFASALSTDVYVSIEATKFGVAINASEEAVKRLDVRSLIVTVDEGNESHIGPAAPIQRAFIDITSRGTAGSNAAKLDLPLGRSLTLKSKDRAIGVLEAGPETKSFVLQRKKIGGQSYAIHLSVSRHSDGTAEASIKLLPGRRTALPTDPGIDEHAESWAVWRRTANAFVSSLEQRNENPHQDLRTKLNNWFVENPQTFPPALQNVNLTSVPRKLIELAQLASYEDMVRVLVYDLPSYEVALQVLAALSSGGSKDGLPDKPDWADSIATREYWRERLEFVSNIQDYKAFTSLAADLPSGIDFVEAINQVYPQNDDPEGFTRGRITLLKP